MIRRQLLDDGLSEGSEDQHRPHEAALLLLESGVAEEVRAAGQTVPLEVRARGEAVQVRVHGQLPALLARQAGRTSPGLAPLDLL